MAELRSRRGDATEVEVKSAAGGCPSLGPTLCAFANMPEGGTILLGLDEVLGFAPVGIDDLATLEQGVAAQAREGVTPPVTCTFQTVEFERHQVLVCHVAGLPLATRPARHNGHAYLRQSDGNYAMSEQELAQIALQQTQATRPTRPDREAVPGTSVHDLDDELTGAFVDVTRSESRRSASLSDHEILRRAGVVALDGEQLTLAGLYALGSYPQQFQPNLSITAAVLLPRGSGGRTRDLVHLDGPLPELLDQAMQWVRRNTRATMGYDDRGHGVDRPELPMIAVREVIANALVHRNLDAITDSKRVEIRLLDDKLVITSPGGLWGVSEQQLGQPDGKSAVNPTLYDIAKRVRLDVGSRVIEGEGGGIREALLALREAGLRPPTFIDAGVRFSVLISRHTLIDEQDLAWLADLPTTTALTSEQRAVLAGMRRGQAWTNGMVRTHFHPMDSVDARHLLQGLVDQGLAEMVGSRGTASYVLASQPAQPLPNEVPDDVARSAKHAAVVWSVLTGPLTLREIHAQLPELNVRQVRHALNRLRTAGFVALDGAQGDRDSRYRRQGDGLW